MKKIIYICDRCGKELEDDRQNEEILYRKEFGKDDTLTIRFIRMYVNDNDTSTRNASEYHQVSFCDKCKKEFVEFFNAPFLEAENEKIEKAKLACESNMIEYMKKQIERG